MKWIHFPRMPVANEGLAGRFFRLRLNMWAILLPMVHVKISLISLTIFACKRRRWLLTYFYSSIFEGTVLTKPKRMVNRHPVTVQLSTLWKARYKPLILVSPNSNLEPTTKPTPASCVVRPSNPEVDTTFERARHKEVQKVVVGLTRISGIFLRSFYALFLYKT